MFGQEGSGKTERWPEMAAVHEWEVTKLYVYVDRYRIEYLDMDPHATDNNRI